MSKVKQYPTMAQRELAKIIPADLYSVGEPINKKSMSELLGKLAKQHPDSYPDVVKKLNDLGIEVARLDGSSSFALSDLSTTPRAKIRRRQMRERIAEILRTERDPQARTKSIRRVLAENVEDDYKEQYEDTRAEDHPLAIQIDNAGRGNAASIVALRGGELATKDSEGNIIPILIDRPWSQGLSAGMFRAMTEVARQGVVDAKLSVASSGYANKTMSQAVHRLVVSGIDDDLAIGRGLPVTTDDSDNDGALLAKDYGPYTRNTYITPKIRKDLASQGFDEILVRSPIASGAKDGGLLARDLGERHYGRLAEVGQFANLAASNAIGESVTQAMLNSKHNAMIKPSDLDGLDDEEFKLSGFEQIDRVLNPSGERRGFAVHSEVDGRVGVMRPAPQGGHYITVGLSQHYLPPGSKLKFKQGDVVEAGDQLTEGLPDHVAVTRHQGIGEGRRRVVQALSQSLKANGQKGHRRNLEVLARGLVDRIRMTDEYGDYIPDDVIPYHRFEAEWKPRETAASLKVDRAQDKYLEVPVLHYSIGTKLRPSVIRTLQKHGVPEVTVNDTPPPFEPEVVRAVDLMQTDPDWMSRQLGGHSRRSLDEAILRGRSSDTSGTSYVGARAELASFNRGNNVIKLDAPATEQPIIP